MTRALPELRDPGPDWTGWRHQPQPRCPRCDARHDGGDVQRLLPQHRYVCTQHQYWIGPPDVGQPATPLKDPELADVVSAQRRHMRLLRRYGAALTFDAVLTGFLICGHIWNDQHEDWYATTTRWTNRGHALIPVGLETDEFSAARLFAAIYPEAVDLAQLITSPTWRNLAAGKSAQQQWFVNEIGRRLSRPDYQPTAEGDAIAHWMKYDSWRPPSRPHSTFPDTREHRSGRLAKASPQSLDRHHRGALWFAVNRRGGNGVLHHRHIRPVRLVATDGRHRRHHLGNPNDQPPPRTPVRRDGDPAAQHEFLTQAGQRLGLALTARAKLTSAKGSTNGIAGRSVAAQRAAGALPDSLARLAASNADCCHRSGDGG